MRVALWIVAAALAASASAQDDTGVGQWFTHGPMLGRPGAKHMGVWARTAQPGEFRVRYGLRPDQLDMVSPPARTRLEADNTGWVLLAGLKPDTRYYYALALDKEEISTALPGTFKTLPDPADFHDPKANPEGHFNFSFEFACGNNQQPKGGGPTTPIYRTLLDRVADKINFAILNGDWLYEERRDYAVDQWLAQVNKRQQELPRLLQLVPSITGVWENYKLYLDRSKLLSEWHRRVPSYYTYDDHEILNDVFGAGEVGNRARRALFRDPAVRAWYDYLGWSNPVEFTQDIRFGKAQLKAGSDVLTDSGADFTKLDLKQASTLDVLWGGQMAGLNNTKADKESGDPNAGVYGIEQILDSHRLRIRPAARAGSEPAYSIGRLSYFRFPMSNAEFFVVDTRGLRNMHDLKRPHQPGVSILGKTQKEWLKEGMRKSQADFLFVVASVNFMIPHVASSGTGNKDDAWTAFLDEREELIRFWDSLGKPVLILTGDIHMSYTVKITDRIWEIASGPHNSLHHSVGSKNYPPNGEFDSRGRKCEVRWTSYQSNDLAKEQRRQPLYAVVTVNSAFYNARSDGSARWIQWPSPHVIVQHFDGLTGDLRYSETIHAPKPKR